MRPGVRRMLESKMVESVECMSYRVLDVVRRKRGSEVFVTIQLIPAKGDGIIYERLFFWFDRDCFRAVRNFVAGDDLPESATFVV